jgi:hypothetical protein
MASTTETGHAKNVANFESLISICTGYGTAYNPSKEDLKLTALDVIFTSSRSALQTVKTAKTAYDNACNAREIAFVPLKKLCTRVVNALEATDATLQTVNDAKTINHKIQGKSSNSSKKSATTTTDTAATATGTKTISVSQQSFDSLVDNFEKLIVAVTAEKSYSPNEADLQVTTLNATLTRLKTLNTDAINATTPYDNAMIERDNILYQTDTGLIDIALNVKKYVKSVFGATNPQYKQISGLEFRKIEK